MVNMPTESPKSDAAAARAREIGAPVVDVPLADDVEPADWKGLPTPRIRRGGKLHGCVGWALCETAFKLWDRDPRPGGARDRIAVVLYRAGCWS